MDIIHYHIYPPALVHIGDKTYLMPGWKEIPNGIGLKDIKWEKPVKKEPKVIIETFTSSSNPDVSYETKAVEQLDGSYKYTCTCPGAWRAKDKRCKHIKNLEKNNGT